MLNTSGMISNETHQEESLLYLSPSSCSTAILSTISYLLEINVV